jgi:Fe-S oxidoreductase
MLSLAEKIGFVVLVLVFVGVLSGIGFYQMFRVIRRGRPAPALKGLVVKTLRVLTDIGLQLPIFKSRTLLSIFHAMIFFGFSYYLLVNVNDLLEGFLPGYSTAEISAMPLGLLNLAGDVLSIAVLVGVVAFVIRRVAGRDKRLKFNDNVLLNKKVKAGGVNNDSYIVSTFIFFHVGSRFMGQVFRLAQAGQANPMQPFASLLSVGLRGMPASTYELAIHTTWWLAIGLIVVFFPYFIPSKHAHIFMSVINWIFAKQSPRGQLDPALPASGNGKAYEPGAKTLDDLAWPRLVDAYACIMCNRCQDVCPAHAAGTGLSPAALEINKRYYINENLTKMAGDGAFTPLPLLEMAISAEAVWSCTTCFACVRVCPVGNEPMNDIIDIRRRMILDSTGDLDSGIQTTLETIARTGNSFGKSARERAGWSKDLEFEVKNMSEDTAEYLWFVGDYASYDSRVTPYTQLTARILNGAGVDFGTLQRNEKNAGNDVRRVGEEGLFEMLVEQNMEAMGQTEFKKIVTTDPHTLNTLRNEYPQYGGKWPVVHYTSLLLELIEAGKIKLTTKLGEYHATYHDPCYLGRYNGGFSAPRKLLELAGVQFTEMPRNKENSFCCGAGGGQIWMSKTPPGERPAENRIREAVAALGGSGKKLLFVVACPKDVVMYTDAVKSSGNEGKIEVVDIARLVAEAMGGEYLKEPAEAAPAEA